MKNTLTVFLLMIATIASGQYWSKFNSVEHNSDVRAFNIYQSDLHIGGSFTTNISSIPHKGASRWDDGVSLWQSLPGNDVHPTYDMINYGGDLVVCGGFIVPPGPPVGYICNQVAKWNGLAWSPVGSASAFSTSGIARSMQVISNELYVFGDFTLPYNTMTKWDGSAWLPVGTGVGANNTIYCSTIYNGELYIGGSFTTVDGVSANRIAKWNGSAWVALSSTTISGMVTAMCVFQGKLYIGGTFSQINGDTNMDEIATWDGSSWDNVTTSANNGQVNTMYTDGTTLFVGFTASTTTFAGLSVAGIASYTGSSWSTMLGGVGGSVYEIGMWNGNLLVGGNFTTAGGSPANNLAIYHFVSPPAANFTLSNTTICQGSSITFSDISTGATSRTWIFENGTPGTSTAQNPVVVFNTSGTHDVTLISYNSGGSDTMTMQVIINQNPTVNVTTTDNNICQGESTILNASGANTYSWTPSSTLSSSTGSSVTSTPSTTITYTVTGTASNGCVDTDNITITVNSLPTPSISQSGAILSSNYTTGNQWYLDGVLINGATDQNYTATTSGVYTVEVTTASGCTATSTGYTFLSTGLIDAQDMGITIYPNPSTGVINIKGDFEEATLINLLGQKLQTLTNINSIYVAPGHYLVMIKRDKLISYTKLIKL